MPATCSASCATTCRAARPRDVLAALADRGADLLVRVVDEIARGTARAVPQEGEATLAPKLSIADGALDLSRPAEEVLNRFRGTTPEPGAHVTLDGARLKVLAALRGPDADLAPGALALLGRDVVMGAGDGTSVLLKTVQPAGKGPMAAADWWRGLRTTDPRVEVPATSAERAS